MPKKCSTPGCLLNEYHIGNHTFECEGVCSRVLPPTTYKEVDVRTGNPTGKKQQPSPETRDGNMFQLDIASPFVDACMEEAVFKHDGKLCFGLKFDRAPTDPKCKVHRSEEDKIIGSIAELASGRDAEGKSFRLLGTGVECWNKHNEPFYGKTVLKAHFEDMEKRTDPAFVNAGERMTALCKALYEIVDSTPEDQIWTLDGDLSNRFWFDKHWRDEVGDDSKRAKLITWEIDPLVAFSQQLLVGTKSVRFTGADLKGKFGYGVDGNAASSPPGIEYLIRKRRSSDKKTNPLICAADCDKVTALYLDYCGGPVGGLDFDGAKNKLLDTLAHLPRLAVFGLTIGKRQRPGLERNPWDYVPDIHGFKQAAVFTSNPKVVSFLFTREVDVPRLLSVPGNWWSWNGYKQSANQSGRTATFSLVIRSHDFSVGKYLCYSVEDDVDSQLLKFSDEQLLEMRAKERGYLAHAETELVYVEQEDPKFAQLRLKELEAQKERVSFQLDHQKQSMRNLEVAEEVAGRELKAAVQRVIVQRFAESLEERFALLRPREFVDYTLMWPGEKAIDTDKMHNVMSTVHKSLMNTLDNADFHTFAAPDMQDKVGSLKRQREEIDSGIEKRLRELLVAEVNISRLRKKM